MLRASSSDPTTYTPSSGAGGGGKGRERDCDVGQKSRKSYIQETSAL